jgi:hypothetical protein
MPNVESAENAENTYHREATECHLVFFKIQNSSFRFSFFQKLLDIWPVLSRQNYPGSPFFQFHPMQQLWDGQFLLDSTKATAAREHIFFLHRNSLPRHNSWFFTNFLWPHPIPSKIHLLDFLIIVYLVRKRTREYKLLLDSGITIVLLLEKLKEGLQKLIFLLCKIAAA